MSWQIAVWDEEGRRGAPLDLDGDATSLVRLTPQPGARRIHVELSRDDAPAAPLLRAEVDTDGEDVDVEVRVGARGPAVATLDDRRVVTLPPDPHYTVPDPILPVTSGQLDLALVIDGTLRRWQWHPQNEGPPTSTRALPASDEWKSMALSLARFAEELAERAVDLRIALLAFGDEPHPGLDAPDLKPQYVLHPGSRRPTFRRLAGDALAVELLAIPPCNGGDYVDAVADALHGCLGLTWRSTARRLVFLVGDSPGHSLVNPAPVGADAGARQLDVDTAADRLYAGRIELATLFVPPPADVREVLETLPARRQLIAYTEDQYRCLATVGDFAFRADDFDPVGAAGSIGSITEALSRGAVLPRAAVLLS